MIRGILLLDVTCGVRKDYNNTNINLVDIGVYTLDIVQHLGYPNVLFTTSPSPYDTHTRKSSRQRAL